MVSDEKLDYNEEYVAYVCGVICPESDAGYGKFSLRFSKGIFREAR